jgi:hypothetical protein
LYNRLNLRARQIEFIKDEVNFLPVEGHGGSIS